MCEGSQKKLIIMRGLPWTGKSFRAKQIVSEKSTGLILSTDEYWYKINFPDRPDEYSFNRNLLGAAHKWNQLRAQRAIDIGEPLIVIDNTNTKAEEFCCEYVKYAHFQGYEISIEEPTSDRWLEIRELLKRKRDNEQALKDWALKLFEGSKETHNVPLFSIEKMMWRWQCDLDPKIVLENCLCQHVNPVDN